MTTFDWFFAIQAINISFGVVGEKYNLMVEGRVEKIPPAVAVVDR